MVAYLLPVKVAIIKWENFAYQGTFGNIWRPFITCGGQGWGGAPGI